VRDKAQIGKALGDAINRLEKALAKLPSWTPEWVSTVIGFVIFLGVLGAIIEDICCSVGSPWE
jgi:hypothetical protein